MKQGTVEGFLAPCFERIARHVLLEVACGGLRAEAKKQIKKRGMMAPSTRALAYILKGKVTICDDDFVCVVIIYFIIFYFQLFCLNRCAIALPSSTPTHSAVF